MPRHTHIHLALHFIYVQKDTTVQKPAIQAKVETPFKRRKRIMNYRNIRIPTEKLEGNTTFTILSSLSLTCFPPTPPQEGEKRNQKPFFFPGPNLHLHHQLSRNEL